MAADPKYLKKRFDGLKSRRATLENHCEDIARYMIPSNVGFMGTSQANEKRMQTVYDPVGIDGVDMCAAGLHGIMTPDSKRWFALTVPGLDMSDNDKLKDWLSDTADIVYQRMYATKANTVTALHEAYLELVAFGTALIFIGERDAGGLLYQSRPLRECYIAENHENDVDTVYRKTTMTARQVMMQWPDTCSKEVRDKCGAQNKPDDPVEVLHAVYPRADRERGKRNKLNHAFASCYMEYKTETILDEGGFPEFPYAVFRWSKLPGEEYGYSPGMVTLSDVKMLNEMDKTTIKAAQKIVDPPLLVPDDGIVGPVRTTPGGLNYYRGEREITPLQTGANIPISLEMMEARRQRILQRFFADLFQIPPEVDMTATEFMQRVTERMRLLGPVAGRLLGALGVMMDRTLAILARAGMLPPAPEDMRDPNRPDESVETSIEFVSPIAMAQKQSEANALTSTLSVLLPLIEATKDPSVLKPFKTEKIAPWAWAIFGGDPDLMYTQDELDQMAQAEQQNAQMAQATAMAEQAAKAANQGAGAIDKAASAQSKGADMSQLMAGMGARAA